MFWAHFTEKNKKVGMCKNVNKFTYIKIVQFVVILNKIVHCEVRGYVVSFIVA